MNNRYSNRMPERDRNRLPNLSEILNRRTEAPVDLWSYYIFMRDQFKAVEYLDFWLDIVQHLSLCRHYIRGLRQSIMNSERRGNSRTSSVLDTLIQEGALDDTDSHRLSMFLRGEDAPGSESLYRLSALLDAMNQKEQDLDELHAATGGTPRNEQYYGKLQRVQREGTPLGFDGHGQAAAVTADTSGHALATADTSIGSEGSIDVEKQLLPLKNDRNEPTATQPTQGSSDSANDNASFFSAMSRNEYKTQNSAQQPTTVMPLPPALDTAHTSSHENPSETIERLFPPREGDVDGVYVTRQTIKQSSQRILVTYFIPGAERELQLPGRILKQVKHAIEVEGRDDPEVFDEAREYVFQAMERDALPSFLASKALGNTNPGGSLTRLIVGLVSLFAAFWVGFILIFLDWKPKATRLWLVLPFGIGVYLILASLYNLDPILALLGYSEAPAREGYLLRVKEPFVKRLLIKRALYVLLVIVITAAILVIIFALVPGKRL